MTKVMYFDTETTGKWDFNAADTAACQPHLVQLACILEDFETDTIYGSVDIIVDPDDNWVISDEVAHGNGTTFAGHGTDNDLAKGFGMHLSNACYIFRDMARQAEILVAHNIEFDQRIMTRALDEAQIPALPWSQRKLRDTMKPATNIVKAPKPNGGKGWKWPSLKESHIHFFGTEVLNAHTAMADAMACRAVYKELVKLGGVYPNA